MSDRNDGGPAFPHSVKNWNDHISRGADGMSLRDYFAGQCMRDTFAALAAAGWSNVNDIQMERCAKLSYMAADALLSARDTACPASLSTEPCS